MKLREDYNEIAYRIAKNAKPFKDVEIKIWNKRRLYVKYPGESLKYQDGGYVDLVSGYISRPAHKAQSSRDKENNKVIEDIGRAIFE